MNIEKEVVDVAYRSLMDSMLNSMEDSAYILLYIYAGYDMLSFIKNKIENYIDDYEY